MRLIIRCTNPDRGRARREEDEEEKIDALERLLWLPRLKTAGDEWRGCVV